MKYLIGIDASTIGTGVSVFEIHQNTLKYKTHFLFTQEKKYNYQKEMNKKEKLEMKHKNMKIRCEYMILELHRIFEKYSPDMIIMEDTYASKDIHTFKWLCRIQGTVEIYCLLRNIPFILKYPNTWRKEVGIKTKDGQKTYKNKELKQKAVQFIQDLYQITVTDDEADAILIGLSGGNNL